MCFEFPKGRDLSQFQIFKGEDNIAQTYYYHLKEGNWFISEKRDKLLEYKIEVGNKLMEQRSFKITSKNQFINDNTTGLCDSIAPIIISTIPEFGDCNVDPELKEIIIKFDQEMATGMSVIDTHHMPNITDKPKWIDKKTFSIPVKLYQNRLYELVFNNSKYNNFRSTNGTPLNPYELIFKTKSISYAKKNKIAYQELLELFPKQYSYAKIKNIDWPKVLEENKKELEKSESNIEFAIKTIKLLKKANDPHLWIEVEGQRFETGKTNFVTTINGSQKYWNLLEHKRIGNGFKYIAGNFDSIGYISITDWQTDYFAEPHKKFMDGNGELSADSVLSEMFKYPNLIIDVRDNRGGNESYAKKFAAYFAKDSTPYELVKYYNEKTGNFDREYIKNLYPNEMKKYSGKIYVISGPAVMSSNESFILMMKQLPNSKIIGMKTYGSSGNPKPYELSNGVTIYLPSWQAYTLEGEMIEDNGIKPDIEIKTTYKDFKKTDPIIDRIMELTKIN